MQPEAMQPAAPKARPSAAPAKPTKQLREGDLICGQCGEGNDATRKFCSRCGNSLATAAKAHISWWRKIIPHRAPKKALKAGETKDKQKKDKLSSTIATGRKIFTYGGIAILLGAVAISLLQKADPSFKNPITDKVASARHWVGHEYTTLKNFLLPSYEPVHSSGDIPTSALPDHPGVLAIDGFKNTYWAADGSRDKTPTLGVHFDKKVTLKKMLITSGDSDNFQDEPRPQHIHIIYSNNKTQDVVLVDKADPQTVTLSGAKDITDVHIQIVDTYTSLKGHDVSIAEVEFFRLKL